MEWIKAILEKHVNEEGKLDITKAIDEVKVEFPKMAVPKAVFNQASDDLKVANKLVEDLKVGNADVEELQKKITEYETDIETLNTERLAEKKLYQAKEKLKDAGAKDIDYMLYKLGDMETDKEGNIIEIDNKIKTLVESNASMFESRDTEEDATDTKGFKVLDNGLENGKEPDATTQVVSDFETALGIQ